jgi:putative Mg2+ transporter-C (MgtC) family protein
MDIIWAEFGAGLPDPGHLVRMTIRLFVAMLVGAVVGLQRQSAGQSAGLRTHRLVAMGGALFVLVPWEVGMSWSDLSWVIQGFATGIGFLGAGAILKWHEEHEVRGLTTAAGIWMTTAMGGRRRIGPPRHGAAGRPVDLGRARHPGAAGKAAGHTAMTTSGLTILGGLVPER